MTLILIRDSVAKSCSKHSVSDPEMKKKILGEKLPVSTLITILTFVCELLENSWSLKKLLNPKVIAIRNKDEFFLASMRFVF